MNELNEIAPSEFCKRLGLNKAIDQNNQTRTKKRNLSKIKIAFDLVDRLGFDIELKPKNPKNA